MSGKSFFILGMVALAVGLSMFVIGITSLADRNHGTAGSRGNTPAGTGREAEKHNPGLSILRTENASLKKELSSKNSEIEKLGNRLALLEKTAAQPVSDPVDSRRKLLFKTGNTKIDSFAEQVDWKNITSVLAAMTDSSNKIDPGVQAEMKVSLILLRQKFEEVYGEGYPTIPPVLTLNALAGQLENIGMVLTEEQVKNISTRYDEFNRKMSEMSGTEAPDFVLEKIKDYAVLSQEFYADFENLISAKQKEHLIKYPNIGPSGMLRGAIRFDWQEKSVKSESTGAAVEKLTGLWKTRFGLGKGSEKALKDIVRDYVTVSQKLKEDYGLGKSGIPGSLDYETRTEVEIGLVKEQIEALKALADLPGLTDRQRKKIRRYSLFDTFDIRSPGPKDRNK